MRWLVLSVYASIRYLFACFKSSCLRVYGTVKKGREKRDASQIHYGDEHNENFHTDPLT